MDAIVSMQDISLRYHSIKGETPAVSHLDLSVEPSEFISIVGPSGCGKSTILSIIAGLETQTSGIILLDNYPLSRENCNIGYMLQKAQAHKPTQRQQFFHGFFPYFV